MSFWETAADVAEVGFCVCSTVGLFTKKNHDMRSAIAEQLVKEDNSLPVLCGKAFVMGAGMVGLNAIYGAEAIYDCAVELVGSKTYVNGKIVEAERKRRESIAAANRCAG